MKSRISFCNATALKKDITRFAPVWALYTAVLVIIAMSSHNDNTVLIASNMREITNGMAAINLIYGGVCAMMLFGDLFQGRMCNALHTMPMRREGWFFTHVCAGVLFSLVPNLAASVLFMALLQEYWYIALIWLAVAVLEFLFFFGLAVFSVMCAGNRLGMAAVYLIVNFCSILVFGLVKEVYEPLLYGIEVTSDSFNFLCPVYHLSREEVFGFSYDFDNGVFTNGHIDRFYPKVWAYVAVTAVLGLGLLGLAVVLYRRRNLERAGDFLAIKALEPVFAVICTLACGVFVYALYSLFGWRASYGLMAVGVVVGFFGAMMLIKRTVRVFGKKNLLGFGLLALVLAGSLLMARADVLGITRYVPETEEIAAMRVYRDSDRSVYADGETGDYQLETPEEIAKFRQVHTVLMEERGQKTDGASRMYIHYFLENGRQVKRYYTVDETTAAYDTLKAYFSHWRYLFNREQWSEIEGSFTSVDANIWREQDTATEVVAEEMISRNVTDPAMVARLLQAIRKDSEEGNLAQASTFHVGKPSEGWVYLSSNVFNEEGNIVMNGELFRDLNVYPEAVHTLEVLKDWAKAEAKE